VLPTSLLRWNEIAFTFCLLLVRLKCIYMTAPLFRKYLDLRQKFRMENIYWTRSEFCSN
jgi:hypothetical protein